MRTVFVHEPSRYWRLQEEDRRVKLKWDGYYKKLGSSARAFMITGCSPFTRFTKFKANIFVQKTMAVLHVSPHPFFFIVV